MPRLERLDCSECGLPYISKDYNDDNTCRECRRRKRGKGVFITIVFDPLSEEGGFKEGTLFLEEELKLMKQMRSFTEGTIVRDNHGIYHRYSRGKFSHIKKYVKQPELKMEVRYESCF